MEERSRLRSKATGPTSVTSQDELAERIRRARQLPGVQEVADLHARLPTRSGRPSKPAIRYGTGANE